MEQFTDENKKTEEASSTQDAPELNGKMTDTALSINEDASEPSVEATEPENNSEAESTNEPSFETKEQEAPTEAPESTGEPSIETPESSDSDNTEEAPKESEEPKAEVETENTDETTEVQNEEATEEKADKPSEGEAIAIEPTNQETGTFTSFASNLQTDLKSQIEAVLFVSEHPMKTGAIAKLLNASYDDVQAAIVQLIQEYEDKNGGLEIGSEDGYIIQVKIQYLNIVTEMMPLELNAGPLRTLSVIALKEPVLQSIVVDMRGSSAYEHISELAEMDLVTKKPQGLSYVLRTTKKFNQYFRLTQEASKVKDKLQEQAAKLAKERKKQLEEEAALKQAQEEQQQQAETTAAIPSTEAS